MLLLVIIGGTIALFYFLISSILKIIIEDCLVKKIFVDNKYVLIIGTCFSKKSKIKIVDNIKKGSQHKYLRLNGEIVLSIDKICNVLLFDINIDGWYPNSVRLWPKIKDAQQCFQSWLERTPPSTPIVSSFLLAQKILFIDNKKWL